MQHQTPSTQASASLDFAAEFATFSSELKGEALPAAVSDAVKFNLRDTLTCAIAGYSAPGVREMIDLAAGWAGKEEAPIWCTCLRVPAHVAALVNGMMAHARDYDDTHDAAVLHAGVSVVPAAIAAADLYPSATGFDLLAGIAVGLELICRLGVATEVNIVESGFMYTSLFGHFAATAAASRVAGLDAQQTMNALGIAYSQAAGTHQVTRDGALTKRIQPGFAAKSGIVSVQMSKAGITGTVNTFEGADGVFRSFLHGRYNPLALRRELGVAFEFLNLSYKPYPCCRFAHAGIDAALRIRPQLAGDLGRIENIIVRVSRQTYEAVCTPVAIRAAPETIVQAQFSLPYTIATALIEGSVGLGAFTTQGLANAAVRRLARKVICIVDGDMEQSFSRGVSPSQVAVTLGGQTFEARVNHPRGDRHAPMLQADAKAKMADCLAISGLPWPADIAGKIFSGIEDIEHLPSAAHLSKAMIGAGHARADAYP